jgi:uncharacterized DUF497 family protein
VFFDENRLEKSARGKDNEIRNGVIGTIPEVGAVTVVYTERKYNGQKSIRIISARPAHASERKLL